MIKVKHIATTVLIFLLPFCVAAQNFGGNAPSIKWRQINLPKARVIFPAGLDSQANRIANEVQLMDSATSATIGGHQRKWNIVLQNQTTIPNAYVRMAPIMSELYMTPGQDNFSTGSIRWDDNLITHEERHMQQFSNFNKGLTKAFSFFLGQEGQLFANGLFLPDYFFEGDAVWQETLVSAQGRGRMPSFLNGFKSLWLENKKYPWMKYRSGSLKDFVPDHYPIGYILVAYGYQKYGEDFWNQVTNDAVRFKSLFNKAIANHSGVSFKQFKDDAIKYFQDQTLNFSKENTFTVNQNYITGIKKNNVIDYQFPNFAGDDSIIVSKKSYKQVDAFYLLVNGKEEKIRVKNYTLDDYFSYNNGKIVYASYQSDPRWGNRDYSVIQLLNIKSKQQQQLTFKSKYFSPDINAAGTEILAVNVNPNGTNNITRLDATTGVALQEVPNPNNYFFTQTKYISNTQAISAVRNPEGKMALVQLDLTNGTTEIVTPFSFNVLGYPSVKGDTVFYSCMTKNADNVFAVLLSTKKIFRLTNDRNGVYHPVVNSKGEMVYSAFTAEGNRLVKTIVKDAAWQNMSDADLIPLASDYTSALQKSGAGVLYNLGDKKNAVTKYRKAFQLFNFHSWRPVIADPEYGYQVYNDNVLSNFSNNISYTYNYNDKSHTVGINTVYAGWFPLLSVGVEESFNRTVDTAVGKSLQFNSATLKAGFSVPLSFIGGRTNKFLNFGAGYNVEQYLYRGVTKNIFNNKAVDYINTFFSFSNVSRSAKQHINPRWAQSISLSYRDAFTYSNSHKLVGNAALYFPGLFVNHSLVLNGAYQKRDTLADLFSNTFSYARGYEALSTRRMYKLGANYHFPICYPDWGLSGIVYFLRIRGNAFFDYNSAKARVRFSNGTTSLMEIKNRSTGGELYFDTKVWNSLPVSIGVRFSHLLDVDLLNPTVKNKWEIIVPIGLIPN